LASDVNFMAELALRGKIYEVPEFLFYRRHGRRTLSAMRTMEEISSLYSPDRDVRLWQNWRRLGSYCRMAFRVPLGARERWRVISYIGRMFRWSRHGLFLDVRQAGSYVRSIVGSHASRT
jgi:hypothetical protein